MCARCLGYSTITEGEETCTAGGSVERHRTAGSKSPGKIVESTWRVGTCSDLWSANKEADGEIDTKSISIGDCVGGAENYGGLSVLCARNSASDRQAGGGGGTGRGWHVCL